MWNTSAGQRRDAPPTVFFTDWHILPSSLIKALFTKIEHGAAQGWFTVPHLLSGFNERRASTQDLCEEQQALCDISPSFPGNENTGGKSDVDQNSLIFSDCTFTEHRGSLPLSGCGAHGHDSLSKAMISMVTPIKHLRAHPWAFIPQHVSVREAGGGAAVNLWEPNTCETQWTPGALRLNWDLCTTETG